MLLEGIHLPLTTPFFPDGRLNLRKLESNVDRYSRTPAAGMLVLGSAGEAASLTDAEFLQVLDTAIRAAAPHKVMLAGISRPSVFATLALADAASVSGYDAVVLHAPSLSLTPLELLTFFQTVADRSPLPVVLLSEPGRELALAQIISLAAHPNILGLIDHSLTPATLSAILAATQPITREVTVTTIFAAATNRMLKPQPATDFVSAESLSAGLGGNTTVATSPAKPALRTRTKRVGFQVLTGSTAAMLDALTHGAVGAVPDFGACAPQACYEVFQAWKDDDLPLAAEKQERLRLVAPLMEGSQGIAAIKYGCDLNAYFGGLPRQPLLGLIGPNKAGLEALMASIHN